MFTLGQTDVSRVEEYPGVCFPPTMLLPDWTPEAVAPHMSWLAPTHYDVDSDLLIGSNHTWVVRDRHHTILIDIPNFGLITSATGATALPNRSTERFTVRAVRWAFRLFQSQGAGMEFHLPALSRSSLAFGGVITASLCNFVSRRAAANPLSEFFDNIGQKPSR